MRQRSAKIILLCTGILMLVLSVLPHHHHCDGTIRFSVADNCIECRHNTADKHSHPENDATCDLRQLFIMSERPNDKSHLYCLCHSHDQHTSDCFLFAHLYFICITTSTITLDIPESPWEYVPGIALPNEVQVYEVSALRAPPAFIA